MNAYKWDEAMEVCLAQYDKKTDILESNFDSVLIDGLSTMAKLWCLCVAEPNTADLPFRFDWSKFPVVKEFLRQAKL